MCEQQNKKGINASLQDHHHNKEHATWSRRGFLQTLGLAGGTSLMMGGLPLSVMGSSILSMGLGGVQNDRVLVLIRLKGGNDGLNTVIPLYDYSRYRNFRPGISIPENQVLSLDQNLGLHPAMSALMNMWNEGQMKIINNVGYPQQNLSHFGSSDIWATASNSNNILSTGFMGRIFDDKYPEYLINPPAIPPAIQIGGLGNLAFTGTDDVNYAVAVSTPDLLEYIAEKGSLYDPTDVPDCLYGSQLSYVRTIANNTFRYAKVISDAFKSADNQAQYQGAFGEQMAITARLIKGGLGTRLYMVTLDGFDTHANQPNAHAALLQALAVNVKAFYDDLRSAGYEEKVTAFSFSEFGRRPQQNASQGTDHGAAAPVFVFGPAVKTQGLLGGLPDLANLDADGNLRHAVDFRSVYASFLDDWLCLEDGITDIALGNNFDRLPLGFDCMPVSVFETKEVLAVRHQARYDRMGVASIWLDIPMDTVFSIQLYTALGQEIFKWPKTYYQRGEHLISLQSIQQEFMTGFYIYKFEIGNRVYSGKVLLGNR